MVIARAPLPAPRVASGRFASRPVCLLTTLHPERALTLALVQHLSEEVPELEFTIVPREEVALVWICGYEEGHADTIRAWRARLPQALLVVTSRDSESSAHEALAAGADEVLAWPAALPSLVDLVRARSLRRPA